jgi:galactose-1-phosphate uridylyltransferase
MTQRIAPNNQYPPTQFLEVWKSKGGTLMQHNAKTDIKFLETTIGVTSAHGHKTIVVFKIRPNVLRTKHNFNK